MAQKLPKLSQNAHYSTVFDSIQHYPTLKKVFVSYTNQIGWPVLIQFQYRIAKPIPNIFE